MAQGCVPTNNLSEIDNKGTYTIEYCDRYEYPPRLHINAYAGSLDRDRQNEDVSWYSSSWNNMCEMEALAIKEDIITYNNVHVGFATYATERGYANTESDSIFNKRVIPIVRSLIKQMEPNIRDYKKHSGFLFSHSMVDSSISITADKTLFGRLPGEELSDKFLISTSAPYFRVWYSTFEPIDSGISGFGLTANAFFIKGMAFAQSRVANGLYEITFANIPEEQYDDLTVRITIPVVVYINKLAYYRGNEEEHTRRDIISGSTTIYFGLTAKENWHRNHVRILNYSPKIAEEDRYW